MPAPNEITPAQPSKLIGTPDLPAVFDVSTDADFSEDPLMIPTAVRHPHGDTAGLIARLAARDCVIVCQKGKKISQGMAAWLRAEGFNAQYLQGGNHGWRDTPAAPRVLAKAIPDAVQVATLWVTRHRPKIDRIACPWLIRRFVDPEARFLFVAPEAVAGVADRYGATPFDVEGVFWTHRGPKCTFDTMLDEFEIHTDALDRLARVIRAADTDTHGDAPEAAGLLALSVGLSRQYRDDTAQLDAGLRICDALFRWARDGTGESHGWPTGQRA